MKIVKCAWCGKFFEKAQKRINQTQKKEQQHACSRKCSSALTNESRRCEPTTNNSRYAREDKEKFPEKNYARYLVRQATKSNKLIPKKECEVCGLVNRIEAHHPDYSRPYFLL